MGHKKIPFMKEQYQAYFSMGAAVNTETISTHQDLILNHFSSITAENEMKPIYIMPERGQFSFGKADKIVDFARQNNLQMRGHTLVWHNQTPDHFFKTEDGHNVTANELHSILKEYITRVFEHFNDNVYCWDVVNEAVADEGPDLYRKTRWLEILGENYLDKVFTLARDIDPEVYLFYNDYNAVRPAKRDKIYRLLKGMLNRGVPVDGIGIQGHWNIYDFELDDIKQAIEKYASLGLMIHITELDVSVYSGHDKAGLKKPSEEVMEKQVQFYEDIFDLFRSYKDVIENVTFWGVADDYTWLDNFPVKNRKNWPLLFDTNHKPKKAYWRVVNWEG